MVQQEIERNNSVETYVEVTIQKENYQFPISDDIMAEDY